MARKGELCAVAKRHSSTAVHSNTTETWTWEIGRIARASRDGKTIRQAVIDRNLDTGEVESFWEGDYGLWWKCLTISPERQKDAATLLGREFASIEELRAAFPPINTELPAG